MRGRLRARCMFCRRSVQPTVIGFMLAYGAGDYVLYTFALAYLISSFALLAVGIETKGRVLEQILQPKIA
jgi:hypothetical protein